jgi:hypothetical protein
LLLPVESLVSPVLVICLLWCHFSQDSESCIRIYIISILGILGPKLCILYLSPFIPLKRRFHLHISGWRNLNRGICYTPIFDLRSRVTFIYHISLVRNNFIFFKEKFGREVF